MQKRRTSSEALPDLVDRDEQLDIIGGAAGCILSLLALYRNSRSESAIDCAIRCGELLVARAKKQANGWAWPNAKFGRRPLVGFSHGAAGIAYALTELATQSQREIYYDLALEGMAYERSVFDVGVENSPDFREVDASETAGQWSPVSWCNGAAGIGLGRLNMLEHFDDAAIRAEIEAGVSATLAWGLGDNQSLCHGALGNLEFLFQAGEKLARPDILISANHLRLSLLRDVATKRWKCGLPWLLSLRV